jgi:hypothetical protein
MRKKTGRRTNALSAFARSGSKNSFFSNRLKSPFSKIKQIYGDELERFELQHSSSDLQYNKVLIQHKKEIKEKALKQFRKEQRQNFFIISLIVAFCILFIIFVNYYLLVLIKSYWP